jgi:hypothetical protein
LKLSGPSHARQCQHNSPIPTHRTSQHTRTTQESEKNNHGHKGKSHLEFDKTHAFHSRANIHAEHKSQKEQARTQRKVTP